MCKADEEKFKDVDDLISEATQKSGEEQHWQAIRHYDGDDAVAYYITLVQPLLGEK